MGRILKKIVLISLLLVLTTLTVNAEASTLKTYYKSEKTEKIFSGVEYIYNKRLTNTGLLDIHILKIDLADRNIKLANVYDKENQGAKLNLKSLFEKEGNIISGINGDFFEMTLTPSFEIGIVANNGNIEKLSAGDQYNYYSNSMLTFFLNQNSIPFMEFITPEVTATNGVETLDIFYYNKLGNKDEMVYLSNPIFTTTEKMDKLNASMYKILVTNNTIMKISEQFETFEIPANSYVLCIPVKYEEKWRNFRVGERLSLDLSLNIENDIEMALSGAGKIISNGQIVQEGYIVTGRNPRTAIGYDRNKRSLYMFVINGREDVSVGATHNELGEIMLEYGIDNAMHLDGGGSTTMFAKKFYTDTLFNSNQLTSLRGVVNGLAVKSVAPKGSLTGIKIKFESEKVMKGSGLGFKVYGYDKNYNEIEVPQDKVEIVSKTLDVVRRGNRLVFNNEGRIEIQTTYNGFRDNVTIDVYNNPVQLKMANSDVTLNLNEKETLNCQAIIEEGLTPVLDYHAITYTVVPSSLATVTEGVVTPLKKGVGYIEASYQNVSVSLLLTVGYNEQILENFRNASNKEIKSYPEHIKGTFKTLSNKLELQYHFIPGDAAEAVYLTFQSPIILPSQSVKLEVEVEGDSGGNALKAKIVDGDKKSYNVSFTSSIDFLEKKTLTAEIPKGLKEPVSLERIYVVTENPLSEMISSIYLYSLTVLSAQGKEAVNLPSAKTVDGYAKDKTIADIVEGDLIFYNHAISETLLSKYMDYRVGRKLKTIKDYILVHNRDTAHITGIEMAGGFITYDNSNLKIIRLGTLNGSVASLDATQYTKLESVLETNNAKNVIVMLNSNLDVQKNDKNMLDFILSNYYNETRANIYVVCFMAQGTSSEKAQNGIRYITLVQDAQNLENDKALIFRFQQNGSLNVNYNIIDINKLIK